MRKISDLGTQNIMSDTRHTKVLIVGSGPAGYTAGVYASRAMLEPILVQGMEPGGQLTTTTEVENWPGDTEVQGPDLMVRMEAHASAMGCEIIGDMINNLDLSKRPFTATGDSGTIYTADAVILATGSNSGPKSGARCVMVILGSPKLSSISIGTIPVRVSNVICNAWISSRLISEMAVANVGCPAKGISPPAKKYLTLKSATSEGPTKVHSVSDVSFTNAQHISSGSPFLS